MKKLLILLFSLLISFNSLGETGCSEKNSKWADLIESTVYFQIRDNSYYLPNQSKPYSGENLCVYERSSGQFYLKGVIKKGKKHGIEKIWNENGELMSEYKYKNGVLLRKTIFGNDSIKIAEINLNKLGQKHGKEIYWHDNGQKSSEVYFKNGELNGVATSWDENGQKTIVSTLKNDNLHGRYTEFYENGQKQAEGNFKNDKFDGKWIEWYEDGQIKSKATYKDGECMRGDCD